MKNWFEQNAIPQVEVKVPNDKFENLIREIGVGHACEWFGYDGDGHFAKETVNALCVNAEINNPFAFDKNGEYVLVED